MWQGFAASFAFLRAFDRHLIAYMDLIVCVNLVYSHVAALYINATTCNNRNKNDNHRNIMLRTSVTLAQAHTFEIVHENNRMEERTNMKTHVWQQKTCRHSNGRPQDMRKPKEAEDI